MFILLYVFLVIIDYSINYMFVLLSLYIFFLIIVVYFPVNLSYDGLILLLSFYNGILSTFFLLHITCAFFRVLINIMV